MHRPPLVRRHLRLHVSSVLTREIACIRVLKLLLIVLFALAFPFSFPFTLVTLLIGSSRVRSLILWTNARCDLRSFRLVAFTASILGETGEAACRITLFRR